MSATPDFDTYQEIITAQFHMWLRNVVQPIMRQRDDLAEEVARLRAERGRFFNSPPPGSGMRVEGRAE